MGAAFQNSRAKYATALFNSHGAPLFTFVLQTFHILAFFPHFFRTKTVTQFLAPEQRIALTAATEEERNLTPAIWLELPWFLVQIYM